MYEIKNGSARLVSALYRRKEDESFINQIAELLNYMPEQLKQDIDALHDYYDASSATDTALCK